MRRAVTRRSYRSQSASSTAATVGRRSPPARVAANTWRAGAGGLSGRTTAPGGTRGLREARHERDAEPRGHQRHRRVEVERPVLEGRREAGRGAAVQRHVVAGGAVGRADERLVRQLRQVDLGARGERVVGGQNGVERVGQQRAPVEAQVVARRG